MLPTGSRSAARPRQNRHVRFNSVSAGEIIRSTGRERLGSQPRLAPRLRVVGRRRVDDEGCVLHQSSAARLRVQHRCGAMQQRPLLGLQQMSKSLRGDAEPEASRLLGSSFDPHLLPEFRERHSTTLGHEAVEVRFGHVGFPGANRLLRWLEDSQPTTGLGAKLERLPALHQRTHDVRVLFLRAHRLTGHIKHHHGDSPFPNSSTAIASTVTT